jgi:soluble lytic murein transglycosylase-like protein
MRYSRNISRILIQGLLIAAFLLLHPSGAFARDDEYFGQNSPVPVQDSAEPPEEAAPAAEDTIPEIPEAPSVPFVPEGSGAEAWYYEARRMESEALKAPPSGPAIPAMDAESIKTMYSLAFHFGEKSAAREAGRVLIKKALDDLDPGRAISLSNIWLDYFGPDQEIFLGLMRIGLETGDPASVLSNLESLRRSLPTVAKAKASELAFYEFSAKKAGGDSSWIGQATQLLKAPSIDAWSAKALRLLSAAPGVDAAAAELGLMRADFSDRQYGSATLHAQAAVSLLRDPAALRAIVSEAGKSFVNAGETDKGLAFFSGFFFEENNGAGLPPDIAERTLAALATGKFRENLWVAAYYLARLLQSSAREQEAAVLFLGLTENPPTASDADGALWYWLDITMRRIASVDLSGFDDFLDTGAGMAEVAESATGVAASMSHNAEGSNAARRSLQFGALVEASQRWKSPANFEDIIEGFNRGLMKEKSWDDIVSLFVLTGDRISKATRTRLQYLAGRLIEEGYAQWGMEAGEGNNRAREYFQAIVDDQAAEEYYRSMAAWRLGVVPPFLRQMPELPDSALYRMEPAVGVKTPPDAVQSSLTLIRNYLAYNLDSMASSVAVGLIGSLDKSLVAGLAFQLSREGQHNAALRLARDAVNRGAAAHYPELYSLIYPRAWPEIVGMGAAIPRIPEALAYGIIRSESVFDPRAVSYAGAVGLAQLMPATAAETAKGLKMSSYSLNDPADNVKIGMTYYSYMLDRFGRRPMRAMFAYNAGPGRMTTWQKEFGDIPDDILLEGLHLAQPRQYARNIVQATLAYSKIHYGIPADAMLEYLVKGAFPEKPAVAAISAIAIAEAEAPSPPTESVAVAPAAPAVQTDEAAPAAITMAASGEEAAAAPAPAESQPAVPANPDPNETHFHDAR